MNLHRPRRSLARALSRSLFLLPLLAFGHGLHAVSVKLDLGPQNVLNELGIGDAGKLFDEQALAGDPRAGTGGTMTSAWFPGWTDWYWPVSALIDLGGECRIDAISFWDHNSNGLLEIEAKIDGVWTLILTDPQTRWPRQWATKNVTVPGARYLRLKETAKDAVPAELVIYGERLEAVQIPAPVAHVPPTIDQFLGANALHNSPIGRLAAFGTIREYHNWNWTAAGSSPAHPNEQNKWSFAYTGGWNFDRYYDNMVSLGIEVVPCKKETVSWLNPNSNAKPILAGSGRDPKLPSSYIEHADHLFQTAARFGSVVHPPSSLKLHPNEAPLSGLGTIRYIENWNEQDATWWGRAEFFTAYEYAAMSSADADGHLGTMGPGIGMKAADPNMRLVMGGTAGIELDFIKLMKFWCDENRGGDFPWDVLNVHHYSNDGGGQNNTRTKGISPEDDDLRGRMAAVVDHRNRYLPGKEVWNTEFGYDVHPSSVQRAPAFGTMTAEQVQGAWLVRSYLALAAAGVDRAYMYMLEDSSTGNGTKYSTSGVITDKASGSVARPSWYYLKTMRERLRGLRYHSDQDSGRADVLIHRFADAAGVIKAYAVWCPTSEDKTVANYSLAITGSPAKLVRLEHNQPFGVESALSITGGAVSINVSETPVFVTVGAQGAMHELDAHFPLTASMITAEGIVGSKPPTNIGDEQALAAKAHYIPGNEPALPEDRPATQWYPGWPSSSIVYPQSCYVDLGSVQPVSSIYLFDTVQNGSMQVEYGSPGAWQPLLADPLPYLRVWNPWVVNVRTRYLRFTMNSVGASINEVAIYTNPSTVPEPWQQADIGTVGAAGSTTIGTGMITLHGAGRIATWYSTDAFHFASQPVTGDFTFTAKVDSMTTTGGKAMLMARASTAAGAPFAATSLQHSIGGISLWRRATANTNPIEGTRASGMSAPRWLRLQRQGDVFTAFRSNDGATWTQVGPSQTVVLPGVAEVGLAMTSDSVGTLRTAQFSHITLTTP